MDGWQRRIKQQAAAAAGDCIYIGTLSLSLPHGNYVCTRERASIQLRGWLRFLPVCAQPVCATASSGCSNHCCQPTRELARAPYRLFRNGTAVATRVCVCVCACVCAEMRGGFFWKECRSLILGRPGVCYVRGFFGFREIETDDYRFLGIKRGR